MGREEAVAHIVSTGCAMGRTAHNSGCFLKGAPSRPSGEIEWRILLSHGQSVKRVLDRLGEAGLEPRVASVQQLNSSGRMTPRQSEVLRRDLTAGYFDVPRRIGVKKLPKVIGVAPSTLDESIRRGEESVLEDYLKSWGGVSC
jgi:predicted DNA binding protein